MKQINLSAMLILVYLCSCRESYQPPAVSTSKHFLVVEGIIRNGQAPTSIKLTRTFKLDDTARVIIERGAVVNVESTTGTVSRLTERQDGVYSGGPFTLNAALKYRLRIRTSDGKEYLS